MMTSVAVCHGVIQSKHPKFLIDYVRRFASGFLKIRSVLYYSTALVVPVSQTHRAMRAFFVWSSSGSGTSDEFSWLLLRKQEYRKRHTCDFDYFCLRWRQFSTFLTVLRYYMYILNYRIYSQVSSAVQNIQPPKCSQEPSSYVLQTLTNLLFL